MPNYVPAAPGTVALIAYEHDDGTVGVIENAVFAFKIAEEGEYRVCVPVGLGDIDVGSKEFLGIRMADGTVAFENDIFRTVSDFTAACAAVFAHRKAAK